MWHTRTRLIDICPEQNKHTHPPALGDHSFPIEPLGQATVCVAMVTKYSPNDELSGNATFWGEIHRVFVYVHVCVLIMSPGASEGYGPTPPAHTNDGPSIVPSVKRLKIADDTMQALMRDGSAGCQRGVQTNKLELNVQKTIEIQVSHFSSHSPTHPLPDITGSRVAQL